MAEQVNESDKQDPQSGSLASEFLQQNQNADTKKPEVTEEVVSLIGNKAAAKHWDVPVETIREWVKAGMPIVGPNNNRTFVLADCDAWLKERSDSDSVENVRETIRGPRRGDPCPIAKCPGKLTSYSQSRTKNGKIYFLSCGRCNAKPEKNKEVITTG